MSHLPNFDFLDMISYISYEFFKYFYIKIHKTDPCSEFAIVLGMNTCLNTSRKLSRACWNPNISTKHAFSLAPFEANASL